MKSFGEVFILPYREYMNVVEKIYWEQMVQKFSTNIDELSIASGVCTRTVRRKLSDFGIRKSRKYVKVNR